MKDIISYIRESVEIEKSNKFGENSDYVTVTLVRRENLDLSSISKEDFIKFILEDYKKAVEEYDNIIKPLNDKRRKQLIERDVNIAIKFAEKKWKTEKKRNEYVENIRKNAEAKEWYMDKADRIFFDCKPDKGDIGINQDCIFDKNTNEKQLERAYDILIKSKYFKKGTGWAFKYDANSKDHLYYSFRPYIDILLNESDRAEQKRDEETLNKSVENFYKNTNYWGD
jgi:hypothetical protein